MVADNELVNKWQTHVFRGVEDEIRRLLERFPDRRQLAVPFEACGTDYRFAAPLVDDPDRTLAAGRKALAEYVASEFGRNGVTADDRLYLRVTDVPERAHLSLGELGADHLNRLVAVEASVERVEEIQPRIVTATYRCDRCGERAQVPQRGTRLRPKRQCPACTAVGTTVLEPERCEYVDAQTVVVREGEHALPVSLEHELAGVFVPDDEVTVVAIPRARPDDGRTTVEIELEAVHARLR